MSSWFLSHKAVGISAVKKCSDRVFGGQYRKIALLFLALPLRGSPWMRLAIKWSSKNCINIDRGATIENGIPYTDSLLASYEAPLSYQGCPILLDGPKRKQKVDTCTAYFCQAPITSLDLWQPKWRWWWLNARQSTVLIMIPILPIISKHNELFFLRKI